MEFLGGNFRIFISPFTSSDSLFTNSCHIVLVGPPGFGKSTTAQLLSREHSYVYYEADCFFFLRNPYIPADVENPSLAQTMQRMLVGEGLEERREVCQHGTRQWQVLTLSAQTQTTQLSFFSCLINNTSKTDVDGIDLRVGLSLEHLTP